MVSTQRMEFGGHSGAALSARLDLPPGRIRGYALFAHCFTCSKDLNAVRRIARGLAEKNIAVIRFDFTGLGSSQGEFSSTNFSSNVEDLKLAARHVEKHFGGGPHLLIGHSLGGTAVLAAAADISGVEAVITIGAPADAEHVLKNFHAKLDEIEASGSAEVSLQGRCFKIEKQFLEDVRQVRIDEKIGALRKPILILHAPLDEVVGIDNATHIFTAAKHPKSFVSLDKADHLLSGNEDADFVADVVAGWAERYLPYGPEQGPEGEGVVVRESGQGSFQQLVYAGRHHLLADEPESFGGLDTGPSPYGYLAAALGACTSMTLRMFAEKRKIDLGRVTVSVTHGKVHADDCDVCTDDQRSGSGKIDRFERRITIEGGVPDDLREAVLKIADRCPVHKTLERTSAIATRIEDEA